MGQTTSNYCYFQVPISTPNDTVYPNEDTSFVVFFLFPVSTQQQYLVSMGIKVIAE